MTMGSYLLCWNYSGGTMHLQGQWQPHLLPVLAKIGFDCGSSAEVRGGRGPATLPPPKVEVHPTTY